MRLQIEGILWIEMWEKSCKYSIRKLMSELPLFTRSCFLAAQDVAADGIEIRKWATITETSAKPDAVGKFLLTQRLSLWLNHLKVKPSEPELPQTSSQSDTTTAALLTIRGEKPELPVDKQEHYELHYNQPTAHSYDGWENPSSRKWRNGAKVFRLIQWRKNQYNEKKHFGLGPTARWSDYNPELQDRYKVLKSVKPY